MDGLRGFLALAVVFHHMAIYRRSASLPPDYPGVWGPPTSHFYEMLGPTAVAMFFMITGYLFWFKLITQSTKIDWKKLCLGRIFRIGPLYLVAVGAAMLWGNHYAEFAPSMSLFKKVASLLLLGLSVYPDPHKLLAGVTWTIQWEWLFYLSLPIVAFFRKRPSVHLGFSSCCVVLCLLEGTLHPIPDARRQPDFMLTGLFAIGMLCASLRRQELIPDIPDALSSVAVLILLALVFLFPSAYLPGPLVLLGAAFLLIVSGSSIFGLLKSRAAVRLGDMSYSIYMLQGLVLASVYRNAEVHRYAFQSPARYCSVEMLCVVLLSVLAMASLKWIERPGIEVGRRLAGRVQGNFIHQSGQRRRRYFVSE
jgi:peptidoglycan/LPS O-acetylase OafA/YrhL